MVGRVSAGSATALMWIDSPICLSARSISMCSGMAPTGQTSSISRRTIFKTPPRLRPGDFSSLMKLTGTCTVIVLPCVARRKSTCRGSVSSTTGSSWASRGTTCSFRSPKSSSITELKKVALLWSCFRSSFMSTQQSSGSASPP